MISYLAFTCFSSLFFLLIREPFTLALVDGFPLETEWEEVSSRLQDSS